MSSYYDATWYGFKSLFLIILLCIHEGNPWHLCLLLMMHYVKKALQPLFVGLLMKLLIFLFQVLSLNFLWSFWSFSKLCYVKTYILIKSILAVSLKWIRINVINIAVDERQSVELSWLCYKLGLSCRKVKKGQAALINMHTTTYVFRWLRWL